MPQQPCRFFSTPGGCRRGAQCTFKHGENNSHTRQSSQGGQSSHSEQERPGPAGPKPPPGTCNDYWSTGKCRREFACRFRHVQAPSASSQQQGNAPRPSTSSQAVGALAPFLTEEGLSRITGTGSDVYFGSTSAENLTPSEAKNALYRYLKDDYRFDKTVFIYAFMKPLSSANSGNTSWVSSLHKLSD